MTTARQLADNFDYYKNNYFKFDGGTWRLFDKDDNFLYFDDFEIGTPDMYQQRMNKARLRKDRFGAQLSPEYFSILSPIRLQN